MTAATVVCRTRTYAYIYNINYTTATSIEWYCTIDNLASAPWTTIRVLAKVTSTLNQPRNPSHGRSTVVELCAATENTHYNLHEALSKDLFAFDYNRVF